jgi:hypothetical protein
MRRIMMLLTVALVMVALLGVYVQPASAFHIGAEVDCGSAGTFHIKATQTGAGPGIQAPYPWTTLVFEEGGVLTVFKYVENGQVLYDRNETGREMNNLNEVTCTFFIPVREGNIEVTGILTP